MEAMLVTTLVGKEVAVRSVSLVASALCTTAQGVLALVHHDDQFVELQRGTEGLHLETDTQLIQAVIEDLEGKHGERLAHHGVVRVALQHLHAALDALKTALSQLDVDIQEHKTKWFQYYRSFDSTSHARAVRHKKEALEPNFLPPPKNNKKEGRSNTKQHKTSKERQATGRGEF